MKKKQFPTLLLLLTVLSLVFPGKVQAATYNPGFEPESAAVELVNLDKNTVVYSKNPDDRRAPASLTKIMTYIVVTDHIQDLSTQVTVPQKVKTLLDGTGSSMAGIQVGDVLTVEQLLYCMMVPSGNDASLCLADFVGGGDIEAFVQMMNDKAAELNCVNSHFMNPHGLDDPEHYSSAHDLAIMTKYALENSAKFPEITNTRYYTYQPVGGPDAGKERGLGTTNMMIDANNGGNDYYGVAGVHQGRATGVKTGSTDSAGYCLVSTAISKSVGFTYLCVTMGVPSVDENGNALTNHAERQDAIKLYEWAFKTFRSKTIVTQDQVMGQVKLEYAWNKDTLLLNAAEDYTTLLPEDVSTGSIVLNKTIPESVEAPIKKGDIIGTVTLQYADQELATIDLIAAESVERSELLKSMDTVKTVVTSPWFLAVVGVIVLLVVVYVILALIYNRKKKKLRKIKKYRKM